MRGIRLLLAAAALPLVLAAGCGSDGTYIPALEAPASPTFSVTARNAQDQSVNTPSNPAGVNLGGSATVSVSVTSVNAFVGTVSVTAGSPTGNFTVTQPSPPTVTLGANSTLSTSFTVSPTGSAAAGNTGSVVLTATSGNITKTLTVYFKVNTPAGDFTVAAYSGDPSSVGDGTGRSPISSQNPLHFTSTGSKPVTVVVKSVNGFSGSATVSVGSVTGNFTATQPVPATISIPANGFQNTSFNVTNGTNQQSTGTAIVTVTSGSITHTVSINIDSSIAD